MYGIDLLIEEHQNILRFTDLLKNQCCSILNGREVAADKFREYIEFGRNYADKQHHGKEEKILFQMMLEKPDSAAQKLIQNGMFVEHDLGRFHVKELEEALDRYEKNSSTEEKLNIITNASVYADLLRRHIAKENEVVYTFASRMLSEEEKEQINQETLLFEEKSKRQGVQKKYLHWLEKQEIEK